MSKKAKEVTHLCDNEHAANRERKELEEKGYSVFIEYSKETKTWYVSGYLKQVKGKWL